MNKTMFKPLPSLDILFNQFAVDSSSPSGLICIKAKYRGRYKVGEPCGCRGHDSYLVTVDGVQYAAHRLIMAMVSGEDHPELEVDHKDRDSWNNHPFNLRWATRKEQLDNRGPINNWGKCLKGVTRSGNASKPYKAQGVRDGKRCYLGVFATEEEAHAAYLRHTGGEPC